MLLFKKSVQTRKIEKYVKISHVRLKKRKKQAIRVREILV